MFEQVMLVGEGRPYIVLLAVSKETDEQKLLERANAQLRSFPAWVRVRRVIRSPEPWSVENGSLTPTLKLKRPLLAQKLAREIDAAYAEAPTKAMP
jgi:long-chain acyl-CoA synthetase